MDLEITKDLKTEIYENFHKKVEGYLYTQVNDRYLAEDLCSEVFVKVYEKLDTFDDTKSSLSTWIYTVARNTLTDYFRTRKVNSEIPETLADDGDSVEDSVIGEEMLEILATALEKLEKRERDIIVFHYYDGMTLKEVGEKLGISYAYVKILHNKALSELKEAF